MCRLERQFIRTVAAQATSGRIMLVRELSQSLRAIVFCLLTSSLLGGCTGKLAPLVISRCSVISVRNDIVTIKATFENASPESVVFATVQVDTDDLSKSSLSYSFNMNLAPQTSSSYTSLLSLRKVRADHATPPNYIGIDGAALQTKINCTLHSVRFANGSTWLTSSPF